MAEEESLKAWGINPETDTLVQTEQEVKLRGKYFPSPVIPGPLDDQPKLGSALSPEDELAAAFSVIERYLESHHPFTNRQLNTGAKLIMSKISSQEVAWIREISDRIHRRPLWQCFAGWYRSCQENQMAQAPAFDSAWGQGTDLCTDTVICGNPDCSQSFVPPRFGVAYCSPKCGAIVDKKRTDEIIAKRQGQRPSLAI